MMILIWYNLLNPLTPKAKMVGNIMDMKKFISKTAYTATIPSANTPIKHSNARLRLHTLLRVYDL